METLNVVVIDVIDHQSSSFIKTINVAYAEPPKATKRMPLSQLLELREKYWGSFAKLRLHPGQQYEIAVQFFLTPPRAEDENTEIIWETAMEGAVAYVVIVPHDNPQLQTDARDIIERFRGYSPVPFLILYQIPGGTSDSGKTLCQTLNIPHDTPIIEYETFSGAAFNKIIKFLLDLITQKPL